MQYSTHWTVGYATRHTQSLQNHLNAGQDYPVSTNGETTTVPRDKFVVAAYLPQDSDTDNTGIFVVAEKYNFSAYIAKPASLKMIMEAMEYSNDGKVRMTVKLDGSDIVFLGTAPPPFDTSVFKRKPGRKG